MTQNTCIYQSYITSLTSVSISFGPRHCFYPYKSTAQAVYSNFMGGFDYKVSQDSCHCSLNWKIRIHYKVQVKSFQT